MQGAEAGGDLVAGGGGGGHGVCGCGVGGVVAALVLVVREEVLEGGRGLGRRILRLPVFRLGENRGGISSSVPVPSKYGVRNA